MRLSLTSQISSMSFSRYSAAVACMSSGIGISVQLSTLSAGGSEYE